MFVDFFESELLWHYINVILYSIPHILSCAGEDGRHVNVNIVVWILSRFLLVAMFYGQ